MRIPSSTITIGRRCLRGATVAVWLLGLVVIEFAWTRSYFDCDWLTRRSGGVSQFGSRQTNLTVMSSGGRLAVELQIAWDASPASGDVLAGSLTEAPAFADWSHEVLDVDVANVWLTRRRSGKLNSHNFDYAQQSVRGSLTRNFAARAMAPYWSIFGAACALAIPSLAIRSGKALIRAHRDEPGVCAKCGYDLRATPERCPECGTVPSGHRVRPE